MSTMPATNQVAPMYRWVGGKRKLLHKILPHIPSKFGTYYEPFFGGGALFFALNPHQAVIGDTNQEVVNFLRVLQESPLALIRALAKKRNTEEDYYSIRATKPKGSIQRAARFLYLVKLGFSGVYRVNKKGEFNVPYSHEHERAVFNGGELIAGSKRLANTSIIHADFEVTTRTAKAGDFVYFDPPYTVAHNNNGFIEYNEQIFSWSDQVRLAKVASALAAKGVRVLISNANHSSLRELYRNHRMIEIQRPSTISAQGKHRTGVEEILVQL